MTQIQQKNRSLKIYCSLPTDTLILTDFIGNDELSQLFNYQLTFISTDKNIPINSLLNKEMTVSITSNSSSETYFNGIINTFTAGKLIGSELREYHASLVPWAWYLSQDLNSCIYENQDIKNIISTIFERYQQSHFDLSMLTSDYQDKEYWVQYQESTWNFISRNLQQAGIYYYFIHKKDQHTMVFADSNNHFKHYIGAVNYTSKSTTSDHLTQWQPAQQFTTNKILQTDYNFKTPTTDLTTTASNQQTTATGLNEQNFQQFDYPGNYQTKSEGSNLTTIKLQQLAIKANPIFSQGGYVNFSAGTIFQLISTTVGIKSGSYYITKIKHIAHDKSHITLLTDNNDTHKKPAYHNEFECLTTDVIYRDNHHYIQPKISGLQTAIVVGPDSEDINCDSYGRVRVKFYWMHDDTKANEQSCWIRVAQTWAGNQWGSQYLPRIGDEVCVEFLNGDPQRPMIVGSVYNAANMPPYQLPEQKSISGVKSHTIPHSNAGFNELYFDDKLGDEKVFLHAQKDLNQQISNNESHTIGNNQQITIQNGNLNTNVESGTSSIEANQSIVLSAGGSTITIDSSGVTISGASVDLNA